MATDVPTYFYYIGDGFRLSVHEMDEARTLAGAFVPAHHLTKPDCTLDRPRENSMKHIERVASVIHKIDPNCHESRALERDF